MVISFIEKMVLYKILNLMSLNLHLLMHWEISRCAKIEFPSWNVGLFFLLCCVSVIIGRMMAFATFTNLPHSLLQVPFRHHCVFVSGRRLLRQIQPHKLKIFLKIQKLIFFCHLTRTDLTTSLFSSWVLLRQKNKKGCVLLVFWCCETSPWNQGGKRIYQGNNGMGK